MPIIKINEIFKSLQGEGILSGVPTSFIRLQGCNLKCEYCDTQYASRSAADGEQLCSTTEVVERVVSLPTRRGDWVCITGGEPLLQREPLSVLVAMLRYEGIAVSIETNGSFPIPHWWTKVDMWIPDIKCPSSGEHGKSLPDWLRIRRTDQVKFVVGTPSDLNYADEVLAEYKSPGPFILISPCITLDAAGNLTKESKEWLPIVANYCKERNLRMSLQIHKFIWGAKRGV